MENCKKIGRPKNVIKLEKTITCKLNAADHFKYEKIAKLSGVRMSDLLRYALEMEYKREDGFSRLRKNLKDIDFNQEKKVYDIHYNKIKDEY